MEARMTTNTQTEKMIYAQKPVAQMILGKMQKRNPGKAYTMVQIPSGWQVAPVNVLKSGMPPHKPHPVLKNTLTFASAASTTLDALVYEFPYVRETKDWFYFDGGNVQWIHKNKLISHEIIDMPYEPTMLRFKVSQKVALAAGLPVGEMQG
jgi:hypothetical protein